MEVVLVKKNAKVDNCLSLMVLTKKNCDLSLKTSLSLINNSINSISEKKAKVGKLGKYFCINPTASITLNKLYEPLEVNENTMMILSDKNYKLIIKKDRFVKVVT